MAGLKLREKRRRKAIALQAQGLSTGGIARKLRISAATVRRDLASAIPAEPDARLRELEADNVELQAVLQEALDKVAELRAGRDAAKVEAAEQNDAARKFCAAFENNLKVIAAMEVEATALKTQLTEAQALNAQLQAAPPSPPAPVMPPELQHFLQPQPSSQNMEIEQLKASIAAMQHQMGLDRKRRAGSSMPMRASTPNYASAPSYERQYEPRRNDTPRESVLKAVAEVRDKMNGAQGYVR